MPKKKIPHAQTQEIEELRGRTAELDRVAKMLVRRDLELSETRTRREQEVVELKKKTEELEEARNALLNMLEDTEAAKRTAEQSRKETELIIQDLADGLLVLNEESVIELANPQAERLFGVPAKELAGKGVKDLRRFPGMKEFADVLLKRGSRIFRQQAAIGKHVLVEITSVPLRQGHGETGVLITIHDITREREIERMKTEFVSLAAHQLRTPLSAIKWTLQMLLDGDAGKLKEEQQEFVEKMSQSNERMIHLINDLLNVTRIEEGRYLYQPTFQQIEEILRSMVQSYTDDAARRGIVLELEAPNGPIPRVLVDQEKIRLAVQNLLENALRYTSKGGRVTVSLTHDTKNVRVSFTDTGMGIPENQQARVFEKFFRATNAKRVDTEGSGLGLYLVKNIVEAHGGDISFESQEGKGTTFIFTLPVKEERR